MPLLPIPHYHLFKSHYLTIEEHRLRSKPYSAGSFSEFFWERSQRARELKCESSLCCDWHPGSSQFQWAQSVLLGPCLSKWGRKGRGVHIHELLTSFLTEMLGPQQAMIQGCYSGTATWFCPLSPQSLNYSQQTAQSSSSIAILEYLAHVHLSCQSFPKSH